MSIDTLNQKFVAFPMFYELFHDLRNIIQNNVTALKNCHAQILISRCIVLLSCVIQNDGSNAKNTGNSGKRE